MVQNTGTGAEYQTVVWKLIRLKEKRRRRHPAL
jgi:hypothetical protein